MRLLLAGLVVAGCAVASPAAAAQDGVLRTDPADGGWSRQTPEQVRLWFADARSAADAQVLLVTPRSDDAQDVPTRTDGALLTLTVPDDGPGAYRVVWVVGGPDGGAAGATTFRVGGALPAVDGAPAAVPITIPRTDDAAGDDTAGDGPTPDGAASGLTDGTATPAAAGGDGPSAVGRAQAAARSLPPRPAPPAEHPALALATAAAAAAAFAAAAQWSLRRGDRLARRRARGRRVATS